MIYAVVSSFASVFMLAKGYTNAQIGMTLAAANILAVVLQPVTANLADRSEKIGAIGISQIMTVMMMVFTIGMFCFGGGSIALCVTFVLLIAWHTALQPMFNALTFKLEESGIPVNFGIARSVGSLAYSILVAVLGTIVENLGIMTLPVTGEIICFMLLVSLFFTGRTFVQAKRAKAGAASAQPAGDERAMEEPAGDETAAEATSSMADMYPPMEDWYDRFAWGAEGEDDNGEQVYFAVDDPDDISYAMLLFRESDGSVMVRDGKVDWGDEEGVMELYDADVDKYVPFTLTDGDEESVVMTFLVDDSTFVMYCVDQDTIIRDIYDILSRSTLVSDDARTGE